MREESVLDTGREDAHKQFCICFCCAPGKFQQIRPIFVFFLLNIPIICKFQGAIFEYQGISPKKLLYPQLRAPGRLRPLNPTGQWWLTSVILAEIEKMEDGGQPRQ
jgi:hypothetical protein